MILNYFKVLTIFLIFGRHWYFVEAQNAECPVGCIDEEPPNQPHDCHQIAVVYNACGGRFTQGDRYCKCSCKTCPGMQSDAIQSATATPNDRSGWVYIDYPVVNIPSDQSVNIESSVLTPDDISRLLQVDPIDWQIPRLPYLMTGNRRLQQFSSAITPAMSSDFSTRSQPVARVGSVTQYPVTSIDLVSTPVDVFFPGLVQVEQEEEEDYEDIIDPRIDITDAVASTMNTIDGSGGLAGPGTIVGSVGPDIGSMVTSTLGSSGVVGGGVSNPWSPNTNILTEYLQLGVGGMEGVDAFRKKIKNGKLPNVSDITYEGLFSEYYFDIETTQLCEQPLCAKYCGAIVTEDPLYPDYQTNEKYLAVAFEAGIELQEFQRSDLNLVILLDVSGSMTEKFGDFEGQTSSEEDLTKFDVSIQAIEELVQHLKPGDKLGIVTFESSSTVVQELISMTSSGKDEALRTVQSIATPSGGTDLEEGLNKAVQMMPQDSKQNRIIMITDANANQGRDSPEELAAIVRDLSLQDNPIFTTLIGVGLDFNSDLAREVMLTRGANYFSVYSPQQLRTKLDEEFEFLVSPLIFDLELNFEPEGLGGDDGWQVMAAYGVPAPKEGLVSGTILKLSTLFPTPQNEDGAKGGIILLSLFTQSDSPRTLNISISYNDTDYNPRSFTSEVKLFQDFDQEFYGTPAIRKAIALSRYVQVMQTWLTELGATEETGLVVPDNVQSEFEKLISYLENENDVLQDEKLEEEIQLLRDLL
eukprot:TRINITY_DN124_c0_g1_i1.p1 TRINITY_DN124_c0_g1~~TRINITY_DN124_c0_g1_i1.p1  ORF type:complete len:808 (-),score=70.65 TRINITY_DN124_c0_g1_i1:325-2583(-)